VDRRRYYGSTNRHRCHDTEGNDARRFTSGPSYVSTTLGPRGAEPSARTDDEFRGAAGRNLSDEAEKYEVLVEAATPLPISDPPEGASTWDKEGNGPAWLLSLNGQWFRCDVRLDDSLWIANAAEDIVGGMPGSPIVMDDGSAVGVLCMSCGSGDEGHREGGPNPRLTHSLPGWLFRKLVVPQGDR